MRERKRRPGPRDVLRQDVEEILAPRGCSARTSNPFRGTGNRPEADPRPPFRKLLHREGDLVRCTQAGKGDRGPPGTPPEKPPGRGPPAHPVPGRMPWMRVRVQETGTAQGAGSLPRLQGGIYFRPFLPRGAGLTCSPFPPPEGLKRESGIMELRWRGGVTQTPWPCGRRERENRLPRPTHGEVPGNLAGAVKTQANRGAGERPAATSFFVHGK